MRRFIFLFIFFSLLAGQSRAITPDEAQKLYQRVTPALVAVQYTIDGEFGRREFIGQGIVIKEDGTVMVSLALFPIQIPDEQMKDFKIIIPGDPVHSCKAASCGRSSITRWRRPTWS